MYDGEGVYILIGDDGGVSYEDFCGCLQDLININFGMYGDMMFGLAGGVGNIDFFGIGVVLGVFLKFYDIFGYFYINVFLSL